MNIKITRRIILAALTLVVVLVPLFASAQIINNPNPSDGGVGGGLDTLRNQSQVEDLDLPDTREGVVVFIGRLINWGLYLAGAIAVVFVIIGGYYYITSAGSDDQAKKGKTTMINALIGIVIIILAYVVVNVVVNFVTT